MQTVDSVAYFAMMEEYHEYDLSVAINSKTLKLNQKGQLDINVALVLYEPGYHHNYMLFMTYPSTYNIHSVVAMLHSLFDPKTL